MKPEVNAEAQVQSFQERRDRLDAVELPKTDRHPSFTSRGARASEPSDASFQARRTWFEQGAPSEGPAAPSEWHQREREAAAVVRTVGLAPDPTIISEAIARNTAAETARSARGSSSTQGESAALVAQHVPSSAAASRAAVRAWQALEVMEELSEDKALERLTAPVVNADEHAAREQGSLPYSELLKSYGGRGEVDYNKCSSEQQDQFDESLIKQVDQHIDLHAVEGVPCEEAADKDRVLGSRALFVNKLANIGDWKASTRWVTGGHRDPDKGIYETSSPTAQLLCHQLLMFYASLMGWVCWCGDVKSAFLQGVPLERSDALFLRVPMSWPTRVLEHLWKRLGPQHRRDILRIRKGVFGLVESPRLWYKQLCKILLSLGFKELFLVRCCFVLFLDNELAAIVTTHVDDLLIAACEKAYEILEQLKSRLKFGDWRNLQQDWVKFCGRMIRQHSDFSFEITLDFYTSAVQLIHIRPGRDMEAALDADEVDALLKVNGQNGWAARQSRQDLAFGVSACQQELPVANGHTLAKANQVVRRAQKGLTWRVKSPVKLEQFGEAWAACPAKAVR